MGLLSDRDIAPLLTSGTLVKGMSAARRTAASRGAAVELTVGELFVPGTKANELGSIQSPRAELCLDQGQTAVIRSAEEINLDMDHAGIAFPAAAVSLNGLLMTNPGYIDPGYVGHLHVTVINMGRQTYVLRRGDSILRCLFFHLDSTATIVYPTRASPITSELLERLSADFMNIRDRATAAAKKEIDQTELRTKLLQIGLPVLITALGFLGTIYVARRDTETRLTKLELTIPSAQQLDSRMTKLEALLPLEQRVRSIEENLAKGSPGADERVKKPK
jgi:dCTP deaminase